MSIVAIISIVIAVCIIAFIVCEIWKKTPKDGDTPEKIFTHEVKVSDFTEDELKAFFYYGLRNGAFLDYDTEKVIKLNKKDAKEYAEYAIKKIKEMNADFKTEGN